MFSSDGFHYLPAGYWRCESRSPYSGIKKFIVFHVMPGKQTGTMVKKMMYNCRNGKEMWEAGFMKNIYFSKLPNAFQYTNISVDKSSL